MQDGIIKGTGNSRKLKSAITEATTWEQFRAALIAGTLPIDLNGINSAGWQQLATALSKGNLLSDTTAAKLDNVLTPDAAFDLLSRFQRDLGNEYVWEKKIYTAPTYTLASGASQQIAFYSAGEYTQIPYYDAVSVDANGTVNMVGMHTLTYTDSPSSFEMLRGKYVFGRGPWNNQGSDKYYIPTDAVFSSSYHPGGQDGYDILCDKAQLVTGVAGFYTSEGYVNSPDSGAYPPTEPDGYTYTPLGQIGNKVQIATGSYTGTGTYGSGNLSSLTLPFAPKRVCLINSTTGVFFGELVINGTTVYGYSYAGSFAALVGSISGNIIRWYNASSAAAQLNTSGVSYLYEAEG